MQVVSYFFALYKKNCYNFSKWEVVKPPTRSLDSPYIEHGNLHFHTKHRLSRLPHEYINTWLPLATLHYITLPLCTHWSCRPAMIRFKNGTSGLWRRSSARLEGGQPLMVFLPYLSQNNPSKRNPELKLKTSLEVLSIICPRQEPKSASHCHYKKWS